MTTISDLDLMRAYCALPFAVIGISFNDAKRDHYDALVRTANMQAQLLRDLARRSERTRTARWIESAANQARDAYELTDRDAHLGEVPA